MEKKFQKLGVTVKETVDFMYEMLIQHPDGTVFNASTLGGTPVKVVRIMVQRGIIERTAIISRDGRKFRYRWAVASKPTNVLYGSIAQELRDKKSESNRAYYERQKANKKEEMEVPVQDESREQEKSVRISEGIDLENPIRVEKPTKETVHTEDVTLSIFGIDELVAELRRRECFIENNKIVLVKRVEYSL